MDLRSGPREVELGVVPQNLTSSSGVAGLSHSVRAWQMTLELLTCVSPLTL